MNDKLIAELAHKANMTVFPSGLNEFAELIVKECSKILRNSAYWSGPNGFVRECTPPEMASSIEEHFGVE
jgi:hypothetical protein